MKSEEVKKTHGDSYFAKTGYRCPFANPEVKEKIAITNMKLQNSSTITNRHLSEDTKEKLNSKDFLEKRDINKTSKGYR